jgi:GNAT superfamily N-acetyltransferase
MMREDLHGDVKPRFNGAPLQYVPGVINYRHEQGDRLLKFFTDVKSFMADRVRLDQLMTEHWGEIATNKDVLRLDPDFQRYAQLVMDGKLVVVTARDGDAMIGYFLAIVSKHLHYKDVLCATEDLHYVHPRYRGRGIGVGMIRATEAVLAQKGVRLLTVHVKLHSDHGPLLEAEGYNKLEMIYGKTLGP